MLFKEMMRGLSFLMVSVVCWILVFGMIAFVYGADAQISWKASVGATGYILESTTDDGQTWNLIADVGNIVPTVYTAGTETLSLCYYTWVGIPETGLVLIRVTAYNAYGQTINTSSGAWINRSWVSPPASTGVGVM